MTAEDELAFGKMFDSKLEPVFVLLRAHDKDIQAHEQTLHDPNVGIVGDVQDLKDGRSMVMGVAGGLGFITGAIASFLGSLIKKG